MTNNLHVFYLHPMPGRGLPARYAMSASAESMLMLLPDGTQIIFTAERVVVVNAGEMVTLAQWQNEPEDGGMVCGLPPEPQPTQLRPEPRHRRQWAQLGSSQ